MRPPRPGDPTLLLPSPGGRAAPRPEAQARLPGPPRTPPRRGGWIPGFWSSLAGIAALAAVGALAPEGTSAARSFASIPVLGPLRLLEGPLPLLSAAAALGALGAVSGIRRLRSGRAPLRAVVGLALALCPLLISAALLLLRTALSAP